MEKGVEKRIEAASAGHGVARVDLSHHFCKFCGSKEGTSSFKECSNSKAVNIFQGNVNRSTAEEKTCREDREKTVSL